MRLFFTVCIVYSREAVQNRQATKPTITTGCHVCFLRPHIIEVGMSFHPVLYLELGLWVPTEIIVASALFMLWMGAGVQTDDFGIKHLFCSKDYLEAVVFLICMD